MTMTHASERRRHSQQINLVDPTLLRVREPLDGKAMLWALCLGVTGLGVHYAIEKYLLQREFAHLASHSAANPAADTGAQPPSERLATKQQQLAREEILRDALTQESDFPVNPVQLLRTVAQALPDAMWLTELHVQGEKSLLIAGGAMQQRALSTFSQQLEASEALRGTPIDVVQLRSRGGNRASVDDDAGGSQGSSEALLAHFTFTLATHTETSQGQSSSKPAGHSLTEQHSRLIQAATVPGGRQP